MTSSTLSDTRAKIVERITTGKEPGEAADERLARSECEQTDAERGSPAPGRRSCALRRRRPLDGLLFPSIFFIYFAECPLLSNTLIVARDKSVSDAVLPTRLKRVYISLIAAKRVFNGSDD